MAKALELIEKLNRLEQDTDVEESLYFHRNLHKPHKSNLPFRSASKQEQKGLGLGKDTIIHHDVSTKGIITRTHAVMPSAMSAGGFEHHFIDYHTSGSKAGQVKTRSVTHFGSQADAVKHANKSDLKKLGTKVAHKAIDAAKELSKAVAKETGKAALRGMGIKA